MKKLTVKQIESMNFQRIVGGKSIKWNDIFENEKDMIVNLVKLIYFDDKYMQTGIGRNIWLKICYDSVKYGKNISPKQLNQIKRNAYLLVDYYINSIGHIPKMQELFRKEFSVVK